MVLLLEITVVKARKIIRDCRNIEENNTYGSLPYTSINLNIYITYYINHVCMTLYVCKENRNGLKALKHSICRFKAIFHGKPK